MRAKRSEGNGFTLIELLVVMAVLALLAGLLMPTLGRSRDQARQAQCISNLQAIGRGLAMYRTDWKGYPRKNNAAYGGIHGFLVMADMSACNPPYITDKKVFICPSDDTGSTHTDPVAAGYSSYSYDPLYAANPPLSLTFNKDASGDTEAVTCPETRHNGVLLELLVDGTVKLNKN